MRRRDLRVSFNAIVELREDGNTINILVKDPDGDKIFTSASTGQRPSAYEQMKSLFDKYMENAEKEGE